MKSSRVLVAVLAVLCLSAMTKAAVIDVTTTQWSKISGYVTYANGYHNNDDCLDVPTDCLFLKFDISDILSDPTVMITNAKIIYSRGYSGGSILPFTMTVAQQTLDFTLDTGDHNSAFHIALFGSGDSGALKGINFCSAVEHINNPAADNGPYSGPQAVDITTIAQSWASGAANDGVGMSTNGYEKLSYQPYIPYLEITTAPVPEPVTMALLAVGGIATLLRRRNKA